VHNYDAQQHRAGQIISPLTLQTITTAQMLSVGGEGLLAMVWNCEYLIIRLKANTANTLWAKRMAFRCSDIAPLKVNGLWQNLEYCEWNVWGWSWQILGVICAVATVWEGAEIFFFCEVNNTRFHRFPVGQILHLNTTTSIDEAVKTFRTEFWKFYHKGSFFQKDTKIAFKISRSCDFRPS